MPISREELEHRRIDLTFPIARLLTGRRDQAFTSREIVQLLIDSEQRNATAGEVVRALEILISEGRVHVDEIEGTRYYAIVIKKLGFLKE